MQKRSICSELQLSPPNDFLLHLLCRKQEELVYSVRKRLEEALMADMLAHVEEAASEGEPPKDEGNGSEDMETV